MQKNIEDITNVDYGYGLVIPETKVSYLVGRVLTIIEALGLKDTQEKSLKDLLQNEIYKINSYEEGARHITPNLNSEIHRVLNEIIKEEEESLNKFNPSMSTDYKFKITYEK